MAALAAEGRSPLAAIDSCISNVLHAGGSTRLQPGEIGSDVGGGLSRGPGLKPNRVRVAIRRAQARRFHLGEGLETLSDLAMNNPGQPEGSWRKRVRVESAHKRIFNNLQRSRWHGIPCFRCNAVRTARERHGPCGLMMFTSGTRCHQQPGTCTPRTDLPLPLR